MKIRQECGQKWYRSRSWRGTKIRKLTEHSYYNMPLDKDGVKLVVRTVGKQAHEIPGLKTTTVGWAVGPIMFIKKGYE